MRNFNFDVAAERNWLSQIIDEEILAFSFFHEIRIRGVQFDFELMNDKNNTWKTKKIFQKYLGETQEKFNSSMLQNRPKLNSIKHASDKSKVFFGLVSKKIVRLERSMERKSVGS